MDKRWAVARREETLNGSVTVSLSLALPLRRFLRTGLTLLVLGLRFGTFLLGRLAGFLGLGLLFLLSLLQLLSFFGLRRLRLLGLSLLNVLLLLPLLSDQILNGLVVPLRGRVENFASDANPLGDALQLGLCVGNIVRHSVLLW